VTVTGFLLGILVGRGVAALFVGHGVGFLGAEVGSDVIIASAAIFVGL